MRCKDSAIREVQREYLGTLSNGLTGPADGGRAKCTQASDSVQTTGSSDLDVETAVQRREAVSTAAVGLASALQGEVSEMRCYSLRKAATGQTRHETSMHQEGATRAEPRAGLGSRSSKRCKTRLDAKMHRRDRVQWMWRDAVRRCASPSNWDRQPLLQAPGQAQSAGGETDGLAQECRRVGSVLTSRPRPRRVSAAGAVLEDMHIEVTFMRGLSG